VTDVLFGKCSFPVSYKFRNVQHKTPAIVDISVHYVVKRKRWGRPVIRKEHIHKHEEKYIIYRSEASSKMQWPTFPPNLVTLRITESLYILCRERLQIIEGRDKAGQTSRVASYRAFSKSYSSLRSKIIIFLLWQEKEIRRRGWVRQNVFGARLPVRASVSKRTGGVNKRVGSTKKWNHNTSRVLGPQALSDLWSPRNGFTP